MLIVYIIYFTELWMYAELEFTLRLVTVGYFTTMNTTISLLQKETASSFQFKIFGGRLHILFVWCICVTFTSRCTPSRLTIHSSDTLQFARDPNFRILVSRCWTIPFLFCLAAPVLSLHITDVWIFFKSVQGQRRRSLKKFRVVINYSYKTLSQILSRRPL